MLWESALFFFTIHRLRVTAYRCDGGNLESRHNTVIVIDGVFILDEANQLINLYGYMCFRLCISMTHEVWGFPISSLDYSSSGNPLERS